MLEKTLSTEEKTSFSWPKMKMEFQNIRISVGDFGRNLKIWHHKRQWNEEKRTKNTQFKNRYEIEKLTSEELQFVVTGQEQLDERTAFQMLTTTNPKVLRQVFEIRSESE